MGVSRPFRVKENQKAPYFAAFLIHQPTRIAQLVKNRDYTH